MEDYFAILVFLGIALGLSLVLVIIPHLLDKVFGVVKHDGDVEKLSTYECGFEPFQDARGKFDIQFYLVAILFIIFDLEIAFLFPWAIGLSEIGEFGFWSMFIFLSVLTIGFVYEWRKGALEWQ